MHESPEMQAAWTLYWKQGGTESLPGAQAAGRLAEMDTAWKDFFARFPDGARLLDLATGGGDIIRRADGLGRAFNITGVDLADLTAVSARLRRPGLELIGNTDLSDLPFPDASFDGVTSQFGIEYADLPAATRQAIRVLAPGGHGHFVLHHVEGVITQTVARTLGACRAVFADGTGFQSARTVFELRRRSAPSTEIAQAEAEFRDAVDVLKSRLKNEGGFEPLRGVVAWLADLAGAPGSHAAAEVLRRVDVTEEQIRATTLRSAAQIEAAVDRAGAERIAALLRDAGALADPPRVLKTVLGKDMGWSLTFHK